MAAETAFWSLLSLPPLLLGLLGAVGYVAGLLGPHTVAHIRADILHAARSVLTRKTVHDVVVPLVDRVLSRGHAGVLSIGFVISLWSGSAAMNAYVEAITIAYDMRHLRPAWRTRALALGLYVGALLVGVVLLPVIVLGPSAIVSLLPDAVSSAAAFTIRVAYWPVALVLSVAIVASLYKLSVPVRATPWIRGLAGAATAVVIWLAGSVGLRAYLASGLRDTSGYGTLAAPIAVLLFFYVTALAVLVGAEVNAELDAMWPHPRTAEGRARAADAARSAERSVPVSREPPARASEPPPPPLRE